MASRNILVVVVLSLVLAACASGPHQFPARAPLARDTDLNPVRVTCRLEPTPKEPKHVSCAPRVYVSPLAWDGIDNSIFRPLSDAFAVRATREARNANSVDEVPDSAWFTNRIGARPYTMEELRNGACSPKQALDGESAADGSWVIDKGKTNGASLGFRVNITGKGKYLFKIDTKEQPERPTAASVIGAAIYQAVGFFTSCEQVVYFKPSVLKLTPGLRYEDNSGVTRDFDQKKLDRVLADAAKHDGLIRMQASAWLSGELIGPFRYEGTRDDDPNDVIPHEDRRELRGGRLLAAWIDHFDAREQNSMDTWVADDHARPESSPGHVVHYYLDTSDSLGSEWAWDDISRRLGHSYLLDWGDIGSDFVTFGAPTREWETLKHTPGREKFGYFDVASFDPEKWKNEYPNPAFSRMTERDGAWMARLLSRFTPEMVRALAEMGRFSDPADTKFVGDTLEGRLGRILDRYLTRLSPLANVQVENGTNVCATDLARARAVRDASAFHYDARASTGEALAATPRDDGSVCVALPPPLDDRYVVLSITDGVASGALSIHLYGHAESHGYDVVGLERRAP